MSSHLLRVGLGVVAVVLTSSPASFAEEIDVAPATTWTVTGHGWGHGHGMSQYGALGAARQGVGWKQILGFYYPGTRLSRTRGPIKVLITADKRDVVVDSRDGLRLQALDEHKSFVLGKVRPGATRWRIKPLASNSEKSLVQFKKNFTHWSRFAAFRGPVQFSAGNRPMTLRLPHHGRADYRGVLRSVGRQTVNVLSLDRYVRGVVPSEVPTSWPADAVRAQAVAARTYAAYERAHSITAYDICDTSACQVYGGADAEDPVSDAAVRRTSGRVLTYDGAPAFTQFSSSNGGWSSAGTEPYLVAQPDPYEVASGNPNATWTATLTSQQIEKRWPAIGTLTHISITRDGHGDFGGRILTVVSSGSLGSVRVPGDDVRTLLGDAGKSTWLQLQVAPQRP